MDAATAPELDEDCVEQVNRLSPRLRLTSPREGDIDVTLLLGEARRDATRRAPFTTQLHRSSLGLSVNLGQGQVEPTYTGVVELFLAGLSGSVTYTADSDVLELDDLAYGEGTITLKHDGNTLFALDLNALDGRRVNLVVNLVDNLVDNLVVEPPARGPR